MRQYRRSAASRRAASPARGRGARERRAAPAAGHQLGAEGLVGLRRRVGRRGGLGAGVAGVVVQVAGEDEPDPVALGAISYLQVLITFDPMYTSKPKLRPGSHEVTRQRAQ